MTKTELVKVIAEKTGVSQKEVKMIIDGFMEVVTEQLQKQEPVRLTGFGTFTVVKRKARTYVNPQDRTKKIKVPARVVPAFRVGSKLKAAVLESTKKKKRKPCKKKKK